MTDIGDVERLDSFTQPQPWAFRFGKEKVIYSWRRFRDVVASCPESTGSTHAIVQRTSTSCLSCVASDPSPKEPAAYVCLRGKFWGNL